MSENLRCHIFKGIFKIFLLLFFTGFVNKYLHAQVKFSAVGSPKEISKNDFFDVQYIVENATNVEQIIPPSFKNFTVVSGPTHQSGMTSINGNVKQFVGIEFVLKPTGAGTFTLPPGMAKADGKTLQSNSLSVHVTNNNSNASGASPGGASISPFGKMMPDLFSEPSRHQYDDYILRKGEKPDEKIKKNLFINLELNKTSCYVGEPIVATYKLYTRLKSESNVTKNPAFNGFSVIDLGMPDNFTERNEKYNGRDYTVYILRRVQLYPLQSDTIQLEPVEVENNVTFMKADYANAGDDDIFFDMMKNFSNGAAMGNEIVNQKVTLQSKAVNIIVRPLPLSNRPKNFKGAVGNFTIDAKLQKDAMTTDEAGDLTFSISGNGNLQMINSPDILWPDGVESFEPKLSENIDKSFVPLRGNKIFNYAFTASKAGTYIIPSVSFSYFDNNAHAYKTIETKPLTIKVSRAKGLRHMLVNPFNNNNNKSGNTIQAFLNQLWVWLVAGFIISGLIIFVIIKSIGKKPAVTDPATGKEGESKKEAIPTHKSSLEIYKDPLADARQALQQKDGNNFYQTLNNSLRRYLSAKLNYSEKELTRKKINELLDKHNIGIGTTLKLSELLENIELNLYAPLSSADHMEDIYEKANEVILLLDKQC